MNKNAKGNLYFMKREQEEASEKKAFKKIFAPLAFNPGDAGSSKAVRVYVVYGVEIYLLRLSLPLKTKK